jgi:hypothetical protein
MIPQNRNESPEAKKSADSLMARLARRHGSEAWRETVTGHVPESWPAARLALQARIAALDLEAGEILELIQEQAA